VFYEPRGIHHGRDEIDRVAGAIKAITLTFDISQLPGPRKWAMAADPMGIWPPGEAPAYAGTDFIIVADGRIAAVYLFFDKLP